MTFEQFKNNEKVLVAKLEIAKQRRDKAVFEYNAYVGNDHVEEHRLSLMWQSADAQMVGVQKRLDKLQKENSHYLDVAATA